MAIPVWVPGQVLAAADINNWMVPNAVIKPTAQNVTSSTTLVNDTALFLPVVANGQYIFTLYLSFDGGTRNSSDLKINWTGPSGAAVSYMMNAIGPGGGGFDGQSFIVTTQALGTNGAGVLCGCLMYGTLTTSTASGNFQLQWAQNTSSATATIVHSGSSLTLQRYA